MKVDIFNTEKKYQVIYADPPWRYGEWGGCSGRGSRGLVLGGRSVPMPYPTMSIQEILGLPIYKLADNNCELYLWTIQRYLPNAFEVIKAWGFKYCQTLIWCKKPRGLGQGGVYCPTNEFLILARQGKMPLVRRINSTWFLTKRPHNSHSTKPEFFQDMVEQVSNAPRIELFC